MHECLTVRRFGPRQLCRSSTQLEQRGAPLSQCPATINSTITVTGECEPSDRAITSWSCFQHTPFMWRFIRVLGQRNWVGWPGVVFVLRLGGTRFESSQSYYNQASICMFMLFLDSSWHLGRQTFRGSSTTPRSCDNLIHPTITLSMNN